MEGWKDRIEIRREEGVSHDVRVGEIDRTG